MRARKIFPRCRPDAEAPGGGMTGSSSADIADTAHSGNTALQGGFESGPNFVGQVVMLP
ncbi:hypothetical protein [Streptomyces sp. NPDC047000]|uniref:hypothetical protein n=1 Tax=Streptomyces sp. NPDC047000 TaxID=3155474 RepID=UPI0033E44504